MRASQITLTTQASAVHLIRCLLVLVDVAAMKQRVMHWVKEVVSLAYDLCGITHTFVRFIYLFFLNLDVDVTPGSQVSLFEQVFMHGLIYCHSLCSMGMWYSVPIASGTDAPSSEPINGNVLVINCM